jgi:hypothetical protein
LSYKRFASICYLLESGHIHYQNYNWTMGQESFKKALILSNLNFELVGVYGKRTKFQQKDLAQLFLKVKKTESNELVDNVENGDVSGPLETSWTHSNKDLTSNLLPKDLMMNDETLLEKIKLSDPKDEKELQDNVKTLSQLEQNVLFCSL